jgi:hypothetical protein
VWMGARWYSPASGTFQSRDSYSGELATPVSLNRYTYGHGDPVGNLDPTGHAPCPAGLAGHVTGLDGNCYKEWAPGDPCGNGGFRGLDVNICIDGPYCFSLGQGFTNSGCVPCPGSAPNPLPSGVCVSLDTVCRIQQPGTLWSPKEGRCVYPTPDRDPTPSPGPNPPRSPFPPDESPKEPTIRPSEPECVTVLPYCVKRLRVNPQTAIEKLCAFKTLTVITSGS